MRSHCHTDLDHVIKITNRDVSEVSGVSQVPGISQVSGTLEVSSVL